MKKCSLCGKLLGFNDFYRDSSYAANRDGHRASCKECCAAKVRARRERTNVLQRKRRAESSEETKARLRETSRIRQQNATQRLDPVARVARNLRMNLKKFGLSIEEYNARLEAQGGVCAICGDPPNGRRLGVDHDHACCPNQGSCGKCVRELLCMGCNTAIGLLREDPERAMAAARYLGKW